MRKKKPLTLLIVALMICSVFVLQAGMAPAQATSGNLADEAVSYLYAQYQVNGTSSSGLGSYDVYVLRSAGENVSGWVDNGNTLTDAVTGLVNQDISNGATAPVKALAQDLIAMQELGNATLVNQLQGLLHGRQNNDGSFQNDTYGVYSIIPAYELLGRADDTSVVNDTNAVSYIVYNQSSGGAWGSSWQGTFYADFLTTAEAVRALAYLDPGVASNSPVGQAISSGCNWLQQQQQTDGSFMAGMDDPLIDTVEAIATQKALGLDPATWTTNSKSAVDYLEAVVPNPAGSFGTSGDVMDATWLLNGCNLLGISLTGRPQTPAINPNGGNIAISGTVGITAPTSVTQTVYYAITSGSTGTVPTVDSFVYSAPFIVSSSAGTFTVEAAVYDSAAGLWSGVATATFMVGSGGGSGGGTTTCSVGVAVVGMNGQTLYGPAYATVNPDNQWGLTALGALDATGIHYAATNTDVGVWVININGEAMQQGGTTGWMCTVNDSPIQQSPAVININNGDHVIWYWSESMSQAAPTWAQLTSGSTSGGSSGVTSTTGSTTVDPATGGTVSLGSNASVNIPAGALNGTASTTVAIQQVSNPPSAPAGFTLLGSVYEFTVGGSTGYSFAKPVTLTFTFDPSSLAAGETPAVYYYDESSEQWVSLGGTVSGSTITVTVDHFTKFAVLAGNAATPAGPATAPVTAAKFTDVPVSLWAYGDIESLSGLGYISGYPDGSFKPGNTVTRAEFVSILGKVLKLAAHNPAVSNFNDVAQGDWFYGSVEDAVYAGIVKGYGSAFKPDDPITREEMAVILVNALDKQDQTKASMSAGTAFTDDAGISAWARGFVAVAVQDGLIKGYPDDNSFKPQHSATRAEACAMIMNFLNILK